jgi:hypothetical protein
VISATIIAGPSEQKLKDQSPQVPKGTGKELQKCDQCWYFVALVMYLAAERAPAAFLYSMQGFAFLIAMATGPYTPEFLADVERVISRECAK